VQKRIYISCGGELDFSTPSNDTWDKFCHQVAWKDQGKYLSSYSDYFNIEDFMNKSGHLPLRISPLSYGGRLGMRRVILFSHQDL
jgi:hypothetical protein